METIRTFLKPVLDLQATGEKIRQLRINNGFSVKELQQVFGFEYPQAIYAWEQGKNAPSIDNLLILSRLFKVSMEDLVEINLIEFDANCSARAAACMNEEDRTCDICRFKKSA